MQALVGYEESERFAHFEPITVDFERASVAHRKALATPNPSAAQVSTLRDAAAITAANLGLYSTSADAAPRPFGLALLEAANAPATASDVAPRVRRAYEAARLRLL